MIQLPLRTRLSYEKRASLNSNPTAKKLLTLIDRKFVDIGNTIAASSYTMQTAEWAKQHPDFVIGFISMDKVLEDPSFLHMTPDVELPEKGDLLDQNSQTPKSAIQKGSDVIIVGQKIYRSSDPKAIAAIYRKEGLDAYESALQA